MKNIITLLLTLVAVVSDTEASHWNTDQVLQYVNHSELQRRSTWQLLSRVVFEGDEDVLDIGCGDGRNTAWISRLVPDGSATGVDPCTAMIDWADKQYDRREFPNLLFALGDYFDTPRDQKFDVITSFFSLHIVPDKQAALQQVYQLLRPGGRFVAVAPPLFGSNEEYALAFKQTVSDLKWAEYFVELKPSFLFASVEDYRRMMKEAGFNKAMVEFVPSIDPFVNQREFIDWFVGTFPHIHYLPRARWDEFVSDVLVRYKQYRPEAFSDDGVIRGFWGRVELLATKADSRE